MENKYHPDEAINQGYLKSELESKIAKYNLEFSRYKQDCRKRALETAVMNFKGLFGEGGQDAVIIEADKYYNWLISIP